MFDLLNNASEIMSSIAGPNGADDAFTA
jgi:hypothetical protein